MTDRPTPELRVLVVPSIILRFMKRFMFIGPLTLMLSAPAAPRTPARSEEMRGAELLVTARPVYTPADVKLTGDWEVLVTVNQPRALARTLQVAPPVLRVVVAEKHDSLPEFNPNTGGWAKGAQLLGVRAQETTTPYLLDPESLVLRSGPEPDAPILRRGADYDADLVWGTIGRGLQGTIKEAQPVFASYSHTLLRIDAVVLTRKGQIVLRQGAPRSAAPLPPRLGKGERRLANIWVPGRLNRLGPEHLLPVLEAAYPEPPKPNPAVAEQLLPKTMKKLRSGERLRILAWGDSVTVGTYVPDWEHNRWQEQFVARLKARFPQAKIELQTEAWGGRNTDSYLAEPPGSPHNYREKVLDAEARPHRVGVRQRRGL